MVSGCVCALAPERFIIACGRRTRSFNLQGKGKRLVSSLRRLLLPAERIHGGVLRGKLRGAADATWTTKPFYEPDLMTFFFFFEEFIHGLGFPTTTRLILEKLRHVKQCHAAERMRKDVSPSCRHCRSSQFCLRRPSDTCHYTSAGRLTSSGFRPVTSRWDETLRKTLLTRADTGEQQSEKKH